MNKKQFQKITVWQHATFGKATAQSKLAHLEDEIIELKEALEEGYEERIQEEYADAFILLYGSANSHGLSYEDIGKAIDAKMEVNKKRKWGKPDERGVVYHEKI